MRTGFDALFGGLTAEQRQAVYRASEIYNNDSPLQEVMTYFTENLPESDKKTNLIARLRASAATNSVEQPAGTESLTIENLLAIITAEQKCEAVSDAAAVAKAMMNQLPYIDGKINEALVPACT